MGDFRMATAEQVAATSEAADMLIGDAKEFAGRIYPEDEITIATQALSLLSLVTGRATAQQAETRAGLDLLLAAMMTAITMMATAEWNRTHV